MEQLAARVGAALKAHGVMLTTAESCTGGGVASAVTDIAGSSSWFDRGFVTYSNQAKSDMLGVSADTLMRFGAVSEATVREMVAGALRNSQAQVALAISGVAGPGGGTPDKPVGTVWFAWGLRDGSTIAHHHLLSGSRAAIRQQAVCIALQGVLALLAQRSETA
ncbi:MAG TPA: nicotinamide-nucleotide amidase [Gallionellaceae bacterium]